MPGVEPQDDSSTGVKVHLMRGRGRFEAMPGETLCQIRLLEKRPWCWGASSSCRESGRLWVVRI